MTKDSTPANQDRPPNFRGVDGQLYLVRCYVPECGGKYGRENYALAAATGQCVWCGWSETPETTPTARDSQ